MTAGALARGLVDGLSLAAVGLLWIDWLEARPTGLLPVALVSLPLFRRLVLAIDRRGRDA